MWQILRGGEVQETGFLGWICQSSFPVVRMPENEAGQEDAGMQDVDDVVMPDAEPCELPFRFFQRGGHSRVVCPVSRLCQEKSLG